MTNSILFHRLNRSNQFIILFKQKYVIRPNISKLQITISRPVRFPSRSACQKKKPEEKIRLIMPNSINHIIQIHYLYYGFRNSLFGSSTTTTGALQKPARVSNGRKSWLIINSQFKIIHRSLNVFLCATCGHTTHGPGWRKPKREKKIGFTKSLISLLLRPEPTTENGPNRSGAGTMANGISFRVKKTERMWKNKKTWKIV